MEHSGRLNVCARHCQIGQQLPSLLRQTHVAVTSSAARKQNPFTVVYVYVRVCACVSGVGAGGTRRLFLEQYQRAFQSAPTPSDSRSKSVTRARSALHRLPMLKEDRTNQCAHNLYFLFSNPSHTCAEINARSPFRTLGDNSSGKRRRLRDKMPPAIGTLANKNMSVLAPHDSPPRVSWFFFSIGLSMRCGLEEL